MAGGREEKGLPLRKRRKASSEACPTIAQRLPNKLCDGCSDISDVELQPPMAVPSVQGFARWNLERCPEVQEAIRANSRRWGRPLRVFSMYTGWGTAEMVINAVRRELHRLGIDMEFEVAWICESNREKCKYLASAFKDVPYIFTDASEVADGYAYDFRTGRKFVVPTDLDMGFIGYPCVDLSSLNVEQGQFTDTSTATGKGYDNMLKVVDHCDELLFLGVENSGNMWRKRKQDEFNRPIEIQDAAFRHRGFKTSSQCVSSHEFGPPQSRRRSWSLYFKSQSADASDASKIFLSFKCNLMPLKKILTDADEADLCREPCLLERPKSGTKWKGQFEQLSSCLDQARLLKNLSSVATRNLPLTSRELHVVALAAYQLEGRGVDVEKDLVVIQVDQNFGRSHRADARVAPCIIPRGKYVVTGSHWRLLGAREKCFLQGVGPSEIEGYCMEQHLSSLQLCDMAGNAFTAQICLAAFLTALAVVDNPQNHP